MAAATKKQIQLIYVIGNKCGLVDPGNKQDDLHNFVFQLTRKTSVSELTEQQAAVVIRQLRENEKAITEEPAAFISDAQIKKIFGMMYELAKISPSDATVKARLCGIISKELNLKVDPRKDIFKGFSERQGAALIEAIKRYLRSAKRKGAGCGHKQAEG